MHGGIGSQANGIGCLWLEICTQYVYAVVHTSPCLGAEACLSGTHFGSAVVFRPLQHKATSANYDKPRGRTSASAAGSPGTTTRCHTDARSCSWALKSVL